MNLDWAVVWQHREALAQGTLLTVLLTLLTVAIAVPGRIVLVKAKAGDVVEQGQALLMMEAMKMELALKAPRAGTIENISAMQGEFVEADAVLVRFAD